jgi:hypothetical protein
MTQGLEELLPKLDRLGLAAKRDKSLQFNNFMHHISIVFLQKAFYQHNKKAAKGVDELSWHEYTKDHQWMMRFLAHRIADKRLLRLIKSWLSASVVEGDMKHNTWVGTPQGGVISPILANIYLHYALDLWVHQWRKHDAIGEVYIVRYADDFLQ